MNKATSSTTHRVYERELPGGGYVAIDMTRERSFLRRRYHGEVVVERRAAARRRGANAPVIAEERGSSITEVVNRLMPAAGSNVAIAAALLRRDRERRDARALAS